MTETMDSERTTSVAYLRFLLFLSTRRDVASPGDDASYAWADCSSFITHPAFAQNVTPAGSSALLYFGESEAQSPRPNPRTPRAMRRLLLIACLLLPTTTLVAQSPHEDWRTIETERFRVHFPVDYQAWTEHAVARLESIATIVAEEVGYQPPGKVDIVVQDPRSSANGSAWPVIGFPRMVLWTSPPAPESSIGNFADWTELLLIHEQTHLAHLLRPSRNGLRSFWERFLPIGPITLGAPRWVTEGYATVVEGRLTGRGRPQSEFRAAVLREWARQGRMPAYGALANDSERWLGQSMAYLVGSAYLEWLVERGGEESLRNLWRRMTAGHARTFDGAFAGVYGETPERLYGRFVAELTYDAIALERSTLVSDGELWQDLSWSTGAPDVSDDGTMVAVVQRARKKPSRLVVYSTAPPEKETKSYEETLEKILRADPEDVAPIRAKPLSRKPKYTLEAADGTELFTPRWMADGNSVLHVRFEPDVDGFLIADLFRWYPESGRVDRLTWGAGIRDVDPSPDGEWAIGVRNRYGLSELVRIDVRTGEVTPIMAPSIDRVWAQPRVSPDGSKIVSVMHESGEWKLASVSTAGERYSDPRLPEGATIVARPVWRDDETILVTIGVDGWLDVFEIAADGGNAPRRRTTSLGASFAPAVAPEGDEVFFLGLDADGWDLRRLALGEPSPEEPVGTAALLRPASREPAPDLEEREVPESRGYGWGRQEWLPIFGGVVAQSAQSMEVGVRLGDVVGRLDTLFLGSFGFDGGIDGAAIVTEWRGWPINIGAHIYRYEDHGSVRGRPSLGVGTTLDAERQGLEFSATWRRIGRGSQLDVSATILEGEAGLVGLGELVSQRILSSTVGFRKESRSARWRLGYDLDGSIGTGKTGDDTWDLMTGDLGVQVGTRDHALEIQYGRSEIDGTDRGHDQIVVGGIRGSIEPSSLWLSRIESPALPAGVLAGSDYERQRLSLTTSLLPLDPFFERHRVWDNGGPRSEWLELVGVEIDAGFGAMPLLRLPAGRIRLGAAIILEAPDPALREDIKGWLSLTWTP